MARLFSVILLVAALAMLDVATAQRTNAAPAGSFRVATWNVAAGVDSKGRQNLPRTAETIASLNVNIVGVQEMTRNHAGYNCEDQPAAIARILTEKTGKRWYHAYMKEWDTQKRQCVESGRGDEHETEGLALFAPEPLMNVQHVELWNGRIGLAAQVQSGGDVAVVVTHLASGAGGQKDRVRQLDALLPWVAKQGRARILLGDLNAQADAEELRPLFSQYRDAWAEGQRAGKTRGVRSGSTRPGRESRIDFVAYTPDSGLELESVEVVDTSAALGSEASDHRPVVAAFRPPARSGADRGER